MKTAFEPGRTRINSTVNIDRIKDQHKKSMQYNVV